MILKHNNILPFYKIVYWSTIDNYEICYCVRKNEQYEI